MHFIGSCIFLFCNSLKSLQIHSVSQRLSCLSVNCHGHSVQHFSMDNVPVAGMEKDNTHSVSRSHTLDRT